jgi:hypothetical protein
MNTEAELVQAIEDYQKGRFGTVPVDTVAHRSDGPGN